MNKCILKMDDSYLTKLNNVQEYELNFNSHDSGFIKMNLTIPENMLYRDRFSVSAIYISSNFDISKLEHIGTSINIGWDHDDYTQYNWELYKHLLKMSKSDNYTIINLPENFFKFSNISAYDMWQNIIYLSSLPNYKVDELKVKLIIHLTYLTDNDIDVWHVESEQFDEPKLISSSESNIDTLISSDNIRMNDTPYINGFVLMTCDPLKSFKFRENNEVLMYYDTDVVSTYIYKQSSEDESHVCQ